MPPSALHEFATSGDTLTLALLSLQKDRLRAVQDRLSHHGLLDPPADGYMGPATTWALVAACRAAGLEFENALTPTLARHLLAPNPLLDLLPGDDLAGQVIRALQTRGDWLPRVPGTHVIAYLEGTKPDGSASEHRLNAFDDARILLRIEAQGRPVLVGAWPATTRSGDAGVEDPVDELGPPRLEPGQYKAWVIGRTAIGTELEQDALVQVQDLPVRRDETGDRRRAGDPAQTGHFVIDQHGALDAPKSGVDDTAVGCLVTQHQADHRAFMQALRDDPRWQANNAYRFMTSLLSRAAFENAMLD